MRDVCGRLVKTFGVEVSEDEKSVKLTGLLATWPNGAIPVDVVEFLLAAVYRLGKYGLDREPKDDPSDDV